MIPVDLTAATKGHLLWVYQGHERLHASEDVGPGVAQSGGAVLGQVVLSKEAVHTQNPGVLHRLRKDPHVRGTPDVIMTVDEQCVPLHEPLEVHMVASWQRSLQTSNWQGSANYISNLQPSFRPPFILSLLFRCDKAVIKRNMM